MSWSSPSMYSGNVMVCVFLVYNIGKINPESKSYLLVFLSSFPPNLMCYLIYLVLSILFSVMSTKPNRIITACKRSLGQGNSFTPVCHSVHGGGGVPGQVHPQTRYPPPPRSSACWEIRATSGRYASYWNAFLLCMRYFKKCNDMSDLP